jgi:predicted RNA binding protein YcfA (HicA-like mRNA interferase family)
MPRMPKVTAKEAIRTLRRDGWQVASQVGSHVHLTHAVKPGKVTVAMHGGTIKDGTMKSILRQAQLTVDQFLELM